MYIPKNFANTDQDDIVAFMQKYSFGVIVTSAENLPVATHIPFVVTQQNGEVILTSHFAKANPQGMELDNPILVIFSEPHAYISPKHYEKEQSVPTWNYVAVHAYGKAIILHEKQDQLKLMEQMILNYDAAYLDQWNALPDDYKTKMLNAIVAFKIRVTSLLAVNKLSQNKSDTEKESIIKALEQSGDSNEMAIAEYMKKV